MKNRVFRVFCFFLLAYAAVGALTACGSSKIKIERTIKREFQEKMKTFPFNIFTITVQEVKLIKTGRRHYTGEVIIVGNDIQARIRIDALIEGRTIVWKEKDYTDYLLFFGPEIFNMYIRPF